MYFRCVATAVVVAALTAVPTAASAQAATAAKKPLVKLQCEEFLAFEESFKPKVVYWAVAYGKGGKPEAAVLDVEGTEKLIPVIIEKCKQAPKDSFYEKVKAESKKAEKK